MRSVRITVYALLCCVSLLAVHLPAAAGSIIDISAEEAYALLQQQTEDSQVVVLDIRTPPEYALGVLPGAVFLNYYQRDFRERLDALDKDATYLVYCHSGGRSARTLRYMEEQGFNTVYHLASGIVGWKAAGFPVERKP